MNTLKLILLLSFITLIPKAWADGAQLDHIFAEEFYVGAVLCEDSSPWGLYCKNEVALLSDDGKKTGKKEVLRGTCVKGGGDCLLYLLITETKDVNGEVLAQVETQSGNKTWIRTSLNQLKKIEDIIPNFRRELDYIEFRPDLNEVYADKELTQKIPIKKIQDLYKGINRKKSATELEIFKYKKNISFYKQSKPIIAFEINSITVDPNRYEPYPSSDKYDGKYIIEVNTKLPHKKVLDFYVPLFNEKGYINFWVINDPGC